MVEYMKPGLSMTAELALIREASLFPPHTQVGIVMEGVLGSI